MDFGCYHNILYKWNTTTLRQMPEKLKNLIEIMTHKGYEPIRNELKKKQNKKKQNKWHSLFKFNLAKFSNNLLGVLVIYRFLS